jgi:hypothetical protein
MNYGITLNHEEIKWLAENVGPGQEVRIDPDLGREFRVYPCLSVVDGKINKVAREFSVNRHGEETS